MKFLVFLSQIKKKIGFAKREKKIFFSGLNHISIKKKYNYDIKIKYNYDKI